VTDFRALGTVLIVLAVLALALVLIGQWRPDDPDPAPPDLAPVPPAFEPEIESALARQKNRNAEKTDLPVLT
jgi:hypothetical protein